LSTTPAYLAVTRTTHTTSKQPYGTKLVETDPSSKGFLRNLHRNPKHPLLLKSVGGAVSLITIPNLSKLEHPYEDPSFPINLSC
jgi:hypothetical protein